MHVTINTDSSTLHGGHQGLQEVSSNWVLESLFPVMSNVYSQKEKSGSEEMVQWVNSLLHKDPSSIPQDPWKTTVPSNVKNDDSILPTVTFQCRLKLESKGLLQPLALWPWASH